MDAQEIWAGSFNFCDDLIEVRIAFPYVMGHDADGRYPTEMSPGGELFFALLDPGDYTLRVAAPGMTPGSAELTVVAGEQTRIDLPLELAFR